MKNIFKKITDNEWKEFLLKLEVKEIALDKIDLRALSPKDTTAEVLYTFVKEEYGFDLKDVPVSIKDIKEKQAKYDILIREEISRQEERAEKEFMKSLELIEQDKTSNIIEKYYFTAKQYCKMVANHYVNGVIIYGQAGLGKTYSVIRAFKEDNKQFSFCSGFTTPLQLYTFLFEHRTQNIIFDDVSGLLQNPICLDILKSALYSPKGVRIVQYKTTSDKLQVPDEFIFEGTITILVNEFSDSQNLRAVADRVLFYELKIEYHDILAILFEISKNPYKELEREQRFEVANWIKSNTSVATKNMNLRLLFKIYEMYRYSKENWKGLAGELLQNDEKMLLVKQLLEKHSVVKTACNEFIELGGSRRTFFRIKQKLNECRSAIRREC